MWLWRKSGRVGAFRGGRLFSRWLGVLLGGGLCVLSGATSVSAYAHRTQVQVENIAVNSDWWNTARNGVVSVKIITRGKTTGDGGECLLSDVVGFYMDAGGEGLLKIFQTAYLKKATVTLDLHTDGCLAWGAATGVLPKVAQVGFEN